MSNIKHTKMQRVSLNLKGVENVSMTETNVWCSDINQKTSIFQCSKIYGNSIR